MSANLLWLDSLQGSGIRPGLGRMRAVLRALNHPERAYPSIIVAGTNGKGSTSATLASILRVSGYRTGLYTSPHLVELRERWMIDGQMIDVWTFKKEITAIREEIARTKGGLIFVDATVYAEDQAVITNVNPVNAFCRHRESGPPGGTVRAMRRMRSMRGM